MKYEQWDKNMIMNDFHFEDLKVTYVNVLDNEDVEDNLD